MRKKYIIDIEDLHKLIKGEALTLTNDNAFSVEVNGTLTNGDVIKAMFPNGRYFYRDGDVGYEMLIDEDYSFCTWYDGVWWDLPYKEVAQ